MNDDPTVLLTPQGQELLSRLASEGIGQEARAWRSRYACAASTRPAWSPPRWPSGNCAGPPRPSSAGRRRCCSPGPATSSPLGTITAYRAAAPGARRVADLCCGIGGDLIALAAANDVLAVDRDEAHARLALHNAAVYGRRGARDTRRGRRPRRAPGGHGRGVHRPGPPLRPRHRLRPAPAQRFRAAPLRSRRLTGARR